MGFFSSKGGKIGMENSITFNAFLSKPSLNCMHIEQPPVKYQAGLKIYGTFLNTNKFQFIPLLHCLSLKMTSATDSKFLYLFLKYYE